MDRVVDRGDVNLPYDCENRGIEWNKYCTRLIDCARSSEESNVWMIYAETGRLCDEHVMQAGISGIFSKEGEDVLPHVFGGRLDDYEDGP